MVNVSPPAIRVGRFTLDPKTGELRKNGLPVKLAPQPSKVLVFLVGCAGQIVTRDQIREHIWSSETFVDFDKGLNFCIKQIRTALGDDAESPTYIETLPRRGYRFIAPVEQATTEDGSTVVAQNTIKNQPNTTGPATFPPTSWNPNSWARLLLVAIILIVCAGYAAFYRSRAVSPAKRAWVLVSDFENRTGESILDGTVKSALEQELSDSDFVSVVPPERVHSALRLMRRDKRTHLDLDVAREVALRDGKTDMVLTGTVEKIGHTYLFNTSLTEPASGRVERSVSEEATGQDAIVPALHRLAARARAAIREIEMEAGDSPQLLEQATTTSLSALRFYSKGLAFINQDKWVEGTEMFNRAVLEDPDFASAHIYLGWCYRNAGKPKEAMQHFEKAYSLVDGTSDEERYFILGSYYESVKGDPKRAVEAYEVLTQLYPDHFWGTNNLAMDLSNDLGRPQDAVPYMVRLAEIRPDSLDTNFEAWDALSHSGQDPKHAQVFLERAETLADRSDTSLQSPERWTQLQFVAADQYLLEGDPFRALQEVERVSTKLDRAMGDARWLFQDELANRYVALGRLHEAERYFRQLPAGEQHAELASLAEIRGDRETLRKELLAQFAAGAELGPGTAARMAREGLLTESAKVLASPIAASQPSLHVRAARGELTFALGHREQGLKQMLAAWQSMLRDHDPWSLFFTPILSDALSKSGNTLAAIQVLEQQLAANVDPKALNTTAVCEEQLKSLYNSVGRDDDAHALEPKISRQLSLADVDHPALINISSFTNFAEQ